MAVTSIVSTPSMTIGPPAGTSPARGTPPQNRREIPSARSLPAASMVTPRLTPTNSLAMFSKPSRSTSGAARITWEIATLGGAARFKSRSTGSSSWLPMLWAMTLTDLAPVSLATTSRNCRR